MNRRQIEMEDGRYLIFYTFDEETLTPAGNEAAAGRPEPKAEPEAAEERSV